MSKKDLELKRLEAKDLLDWRMRQNAKMNKCGFPGSLEHARKIFEICYWLNKHEKKFYTECIFKGRGRADIFLLSSRLAIEILESEEVKKVELKREYYPCEIIPIKVSDENWKEKLEWLL